MARECEACRVRQQTIDSLQKAECDSCKVRENEIEFLRHELEEMRGLLKDAMERPVLPPPGVVERPSDAFGMLSDTVHAEREDDVLLDETGNPVDADGNPIEDAVRSSVVHDLFRQIHGGSGVHMEPDAMQTAMKAITSPELRGAIAEKGEDVDAG